jgi:cytochrome P450
MGETMASVPHDCHYQVAVTTMVHKYNLPGVFYLDLWPASGGQVVVIDPDVAMHVTVTKNHPKHDAEKMFVDPMIGDSNVVTSEGSRWKYLHKMLAPAFAIQHISNMRPAVCLTSRTLREAAY